MGKILIFGASITYGCWDKNGGWVARLRKYIDEKYNQAARGNIYVFNLGVSGEPVVTLKRFAEGEILRRSSIRGKSVFIYSISTNDCYPNNAATQELSEPKKFKNAITHLIKLAGKHNAVPVVLGIPPLNEETLTTKYKGSLTSLLVRTYSDLAMSACAETDNLFLDLTRILSATSYPELLIDGLHPGDEGHQIIFTKVREFLNKHALIDLCAKQ